MKVHGYDEAFEVVWNWDWEVDEKHYDAIEGCFSEFLDAVENVWNWKFMKFYGDYDCSMFWAEHDVPMQRMIDDCYSAGYGDEIEIDLGIFFGNVGAIIG